MIGKPRRPEGPTSMEQLEKKFPEEKTVQIRLLADDVVTVSKEKLFGDLEIPKTSLKERSLKMEKPSSKSKEYQKFIHTAVSVPKKTPKKHK